MSPFDLSVRKVADSLGVPLSTLNRLLNGDRNIYRRKWRFDYLKYLEDHLKVGSPCKITMIYGMQRRK